MKEKKPLIRQSIQQGFQAFVKALPQIAVFEIIYRILTALVLKPLLLFLTTSLLQADGLGLAVNEQIWSFALSVPGVLAILLLVGLSVIFIFFEFGALISLIRQALAGQRVSLADSFKEALRSFSSLKSPGVILFALYSLLLLPIVNMGVTSSLMPSLSIPNFIIGEITKTRVGEWGVLIAAVIVVIVFFRLMFVLPGMVLERIPFSAATKKSAIVIRKYGWKITGVVLVFLILWVALFWLPRLFFESYFGMPNVSFAYAANSLGFSLGTIVVVLVWLVITALQLALMPLLLSILTSCYIDVMHPLETDTKPKARIGICAENAIDVISGAVVKTGRGISSAFKAIQKRPALRNVTIITVIVVVFFATRAAYIDHYRTHDPHAAEASGLHEPVVIGHRGSAYGVENTLGAIQYSIDAGADYTEVDIVLSLDGVPMVIHDSNLKRLAGVDANVYDLTAEELGKIALSQKGMTGRISTLEEVLQYCDGKIRLAVELKLYGHETADLVGQVMEIIKKFPYQKDCIFVSLDYGLVKQMKERYPEYTTGYCIYGNVGEIDADDIRSMNIDFLLVEEWMASPELIAVGNEAKVPVFVWTVNETRDMADYLEMGILGLVTDYPDSAMDVVSSVVN